MTTKDFKIENYVEKVAFSNLKRGEKMRGEISDKKNLLAYTQKIHTWFNEMTRTNPAEYENLKFSYEVKSSVQEAEFTRETRLYSFEDGVTFPADLYIPKNASKASAVLFLCGHADEGKRFPDYMAAGEVMAKEGLLVFMADPILQGERSKGVEAIYAHATFGRTERAFGRLPVGIFYKDILHQLRALKADKLVNDKKIAVAGHSGGGMQTAIMMLGGVFPHSPRYNLSCLFYAFSKSVYGEEILFRA